MLFVWRQGFRNHVFLGNWFGGLNLQGKAYVTDLQREFNVFTFVFFLT